MVIVQQYLKDDSKMHFIKNYKGDVVFGFGDAGKNNQELYEKAKRLVIAAYRQGMQDPQFNHRNWQRSHKSVNAIRFLAPLTDFAT